ncbi:Aste57867_12204 [Aphanomyces stellatus]|uniref:Kinesin-like protein n=1 Tax=Aphanomyces stellatus TaxID=120398 RepID=A0A485KWY7_9STRA|nr:hypothetical protein As57867_012159 [Aphanomyces stellatus]VFT89058.1 Aste57867_12204 [Aphanomyces stellatus]
MSNIHVSCRVRPQNASERKNGGQECVTITDGKAIEVSNDDGFANDYLKCTFDRVFSPQATQAQVYDATAKSLVVDFLDGYNCTVFAYGQTGSGKTHTIYGPKDGIISKPEEQGLIGRVVNDLYALIAQRQTPHLVVEITCSFIEIYMEQINDLLQPGNKNLRVREDKDKGVYVDDLLSVRAATKEHMLRLVERGNTNRVVACTSMNNDSSRSHTMLMINMIQRDLAAATEKVATMYVVDLAGSEMVNKTLATGKTLNEAKAINKSLSALSNVIKALVDGKKHIPFRDSKLTRILQDSLGGCAKTCLIVTVSCSTYNVSETMSTLRFGTRAKEIKNDPTLHQVKDVTMCDYQQMYQTLLQDHAQTKVQLEELLATVSSLATSSQSATPLKFEDVRSPAPTDEATVGLIQPSPIENIDNDDDDAPVSVYAFPVDDIGTQTPVVETQSNGSQTDDTAIPLSDAPSTLTKTLTSLLFTEKSAAAKTDSPTDLHAKIRLLTDDLQMCRSENDALREINAILSAQNTVFNTRSSELEGNMSLHESALDALKEINRTICAQNSALSERNQELEMLLEASQAKPSASSTVSGTPPSPETAGDGNDDVLVDPTVDNPHKYIETLSRKVVEMKLHVHYVTEYTKSILDHQAYEIVSQMTQLKLENERLRFEEHHHAETIHELRTKCQAMIEAVAKNDDNTATLQRTIQEYQALYKEQVRLSQERQQNLVKEVEYYKMIWQRVAPAKKLRDAPGNNNQSLPPPIVTSSMEKDAGHMMKAASFSGTVPTEPLSLMSIKRSSMRTIVKPSNSKSSWALPQSPIHIKTRPAVDESDPLSTVFEHE